MQRYCVLSLMQKAGEIRGLVVHPVYPLSVSGTVVAHYEADFVYTVVASGKETVEDVKSGGKRNITLTPFSRLKIRLFETSVPAPQSGDRHMILFIQFLFCFVVAALIAWGFYWYGREDGLQAGKRYSETRCEAGRREGYVVGYAEAQHASYDAGYKDGWAYRQKKMGGGQ